MEEHDKMEDLQNQDNEKETENEEVEVIDEEDIEVVSESEDTDEKMQAIIDEKDQLQERLLRLQAEFDNYKRRSEKERVAERKYKSQDVVTDLLPVLDNFERALQTEVAEESKGFVDGIKMVYNQLVEALENHGVEAIEAVGAEFDPNLHHAVMQVEDETVDSNVVVEELQKGFVLKDKVIRPAMVQVNK